MWLYNKRQLTICGVSSTHWQKAASSTFPSRHGACTPHVQEVSMHACACVCSCIFLYLCHAMMLIWQDVCTSCSLSVHWNGNTINQYQLCWWTNNNKKDKKKWWQNAQTVIVVQLNWLQQLNALTHCFRFLLRTFLNHCSTSSQITKCLPNFWGGS